MKTTIAISVTAALLSAVFRLQAGILIGPITNPGNGHDYYLLAQDTWAASEAEAERLGGTLAIIRNSTEQGWVFSTFGNYGGTARTYWIGYHRQWQGGPFVWITDEKVDYVNWNTGEPNHLGGNENCVEVWGDDHGVWNDTAETLPRYGLAEVPGKSQEKSLTEQEKSLIGTWYNNGDPDQPCCIATTGQLLFGIDQNEDASRIIYTPEGLLFFPKWKQPGEIVEDRILWSRGNWWSRKTSKYKTEKKISDGTVNTYSAHGKISGGVKIISTF
jgi:hypothetical protein